MKAKNRKAVLIVAGVAVAVGISYMVYTRKKKKDEVKLINDKLDAGTGATGTIEDLNMDDAFNPNLLTSGKIPKNVSVPLFKVAQAQDFAKKLNDKIGYFYDDETGAIALLSQIGTKVKMSQVSKEFAKIYKKPLGDFLTSHIDKANNPDLFKQTINSMKLY